MAYIPQRVKITMPIGTVFRTLTDPQDNWLLCDGSSVNQEFSELITLVNSLGLEGKTPDLRPRDASGQILNLSPGQFNADIGTWVPYYIIARIEGGVEE
jgi:hypothetical protein